MSTLSFQFVLLPSVEVKVGIFSNSAGSGAETAVFLDFVVCFCTTFGELLPDSPAAGSGISAFFPPSLRRLFERTCVT